MERRYVFVSPTPIDETFFMARAFDKSKCIFDRTIYNGWKKAYSILKNSKKDDIIICWDFSTGIKIAALNRFFNKKRVVVNCNMIDHEQRGYRVFIKKFLYNFVFSSKYFHFSVNSMDTIEEYKKKYKSIDINRTFELQDCYYGTEPTQAYTPGDGSIFCGGNIRDWGCYIKAAKLLPEENFVGVASSRVKHLFMNIPDNLKMYWDISLDEFYNLLKRCTISVIPVPSNITNGLIVIYQSALLSRSIIATNTPPIHNLLYDKRSGLYGGQLYEMNNSEDMAQKIKDLLSDDNKRRLQCETMDRILENHSPMCFSESLFEYVSRL